MVKLFPDGKTVGSNGSPAECSKPKDINKRWCCQSKTNKPNQPTKQPTKQKIPKKSNQILKRRKQNQSSSHCLKPMLHYVLKNMNLKDILPTVG